MDQPHIIIRRLFMSECPTKYNNKFSLNYCYISHMPQWRYPSVQPTTTDITLEMLTVWRVSFSPAAPDCEFALPKKPTQGTILDIFSCGLSSCQWFLRGNVSRKKSKRKMMMKMMTIFVLNYYAWLEYFFNDSSEEIFFFFEVWSR